MTDRLDLPRRYRDQVEGLLREHVPGAEVWAYGSRVNGEGHDASDLDLVLRGPDLKRIPNGQLTDLIEALEESNVPIIVQIHDWARLPQSFHKEIERAYVVLVAKEEPTFFPTASWTRYWDRYQRGGRLVFWMMLSNFSVVGLPAHRKSTIGGETSPGTPQRTPLSLPLL